MSNKPFFDYEQYVTRNPAPVVGFGTSYSRNRPTETSNAYVKITTIPREDGADVVIEGLDNLISETGERRITHHFRKDHGPRIGSRVMVRKHLVKVRDRRYNSSGRLEIQDEDTGAWYVWDEER